MSYDREVLRSRFVGILFGASVVLTGCVLLTDLDGFTGDQGSAPLTCDGASCNPGDIVAPEGGSSETGTGSDTGVVKPAGGCPSGRGPAMVQVMGFCIDSTEVTVAHYKAFLADLSNLPDRGLGSQPAECKWNTSFQPPYWYPAFDQEKADNVKPEVIDTMPIAVVNWCDARAFCAWSGKRLCGKVGGGPVIPAEAATTKSEWFVACSHNGLNPFPYGQSYVAATCNEDHEGVLAGRKPVKSFPKCEGGYAGLFDMSGNITEWTNSCDAPGTEDAGTTKCQTAGGPWSFPKSAVDCGSTYPIDRAGTNPQNGIRCCADL